MFYKLHYESLLQISGFVIIKKFQWNASIQYMPYSIHTKTQNFFSISHLFHFLLSYFLRFIQINIVSQIFFSSADEKKIDVRICIINIRISIRNHTYIIIVRLKEKCSSFLKKKNYNIYLSTDHNEVILQFNQLFSIKAIRFFFNWNSFLKDNSMLKKKIFSPPPKFDSWVLLH